MKLLSYECNQYHPDKWALSKFSLGDINLIAGICAVGKTKFLNTLFNFSKMIQKARPLTQGYWNIDFRVGKKEYNYELEIEIDPKSQTKYVKKEVLSHKKEPVIKRGRTFIFKGNRLPRLSKEDTGIFLLRDDPTISKIYNGFSNVVIRRYNPDPSKPPVGATLTALPKDIASRTADELNLKHIHTKYEDVTAQLFLLKLFHPSIYEKIIEHFKIIFPFVLDFDVKPSHELKESPLIVHPQMDTILAIFPIPVIREKGMRKGVPVLVINMSSGMLRTIIQLVDLYTMPEGSIYLIDELENSMDVFTLSEMTELLFNEFTNVQFIFTTHHPYIFNNVDVQYWKVFVRRGHLVKVFEGDKLAKKYSRSHLDAYTQLMNSELLDRGI